MYMAQNVSSDFEEVANTVGTDEPDTVEVLRLPGARDSPLRANTQYAFKAVAVNNGDVCLVIPASLLPASSVSAETGTATVPGVPPAPYLVEATGGQVSLELVRPPNMHGSVLQGFSVMVNNTVSEFVATNDSISHDISFLTADTLYNVRVAAVTDLGTTVWSPILGVTTTSPTAPSSPRYVSVSNVTASTAVVRWSQPLDSGGSDITGTKNELCGCTVVHSNPTHCALCVCIQDIASCYHLRRRLREGKLDPRMWSSSIFLLPLCTLSR